MQRSIIRPVFVGLRVAIELQKRQYTVRFHESNKINLLTNQYITLASYIYSAKGIDGIYSTDHYVIVNLTIFPPLVKFLIVLSLYYSQVIRHWRIPAVRSCEDVITIWSICRSSIDILKPHKDQNCVHHFAVIHR